MNCLIIDDEYLAIRLLSNHLSKLPQLQLLGAFQRPAEALALLNGGEVDLLFLDIQMPEITGLELLRALNKPPMVVLTTAYSEFALDGFALDVIDYLLKPITFERFVKASNKALELYQLRQSKGGHSAPTLPAPKDYLMLKANHRLEKVSFSEILYVEGLKEYISVYTTSQRIITLERLSHMEQLLPSQQFVRCHRSYIVSLQHVTAIEGNQLEINGKMIPIGLNYKDELLKRF